MLDANMPERWFKIEKPKIALFQFIIEGYEGMATVTTMDSQTAIVQVSIMPDFYDEIINLLESLKIECELEEIEYKSGNQG